MPKLCTSCGESKSRDFFSANQWKKAPDAPRRVCHACREKEEAEQESPHQPAAAAAAASSTPPAPAATSKAAAVTIATSASSITDDDTSPSFFPSPDLLGEIKSETSSAPDEWYKNHVMSARRRFNSDVQVVRSHLAHVPSEDARFFLHPSRDTLQHDHAFGIYANERVLQALKIRDPHARDDKKSSRFVYPTLGNVLSANLERPGFVRCQAPQGGSVLPIGKEHLGERVSKHLPPPLHAPGQGCSTQPCEGAVALRREAAAAAGWICAVCWYRALADWFRAHDKMLERQKKSEERVKSLPPCPMDGSASAQLKPHEIWTASSESITRSLKPVFAKPGARHVGGADDMPMLPPSGVAVHDYVCPHCSSLDMRMVWHEEREQGHTTYLDEEFACGGCNKFMQLANGWYSGDWD